MSNSETTPADNVDLFQATPEDSNSALRKLQAAAQAEAEARGVLSFKVPDLATDLERHERVTREVAEIDARTAEVNAEIAAHKRVARDTASIRELVRRQVEAAAAEVRADLAVDLLDVAQGRRDTVLDGPPNGPHGLLGLAAVMHGVDHVVAALTAPTRANDRDARFDLQVRIAPLMREREQLFDRRAKLLPKPAPDRLRPTAAQAAAFGWTR